MIKDFLKTLGRYIIFSVVAIFISLGISVDFWIYFICLGIAIMILIYNLYTITKDYNSYILLNVKNKEILTLIRDNICSIINKYVSEIILLVIIISIISVIYSYSFGTIICMCSIISSIFSRKSFIKFMEDLKNTINKEKQ